MLLAMLTLTHLLQSCAPEVGPRTMTAIVHVESGGNALAVRDNTLNRAFYPKSTEEAVRLATYLLYKHHNLDLGISQVNSLNLPGLGISVRQAFNPCDNLRGGARILAGDYRRAVAQFGAGQYALRRAIGAYNTGSLYAGDRYISMILDAAGIRDVYANVARVPNLAAESGYGARRASQESEAGEPVQEAVRAPIAAAPASVAVSPEDSPILVHWGQESSPVLAAGGTGGLTHIPLTGTVQQSAAAMPSAPDQSTASVSAPIILRALPINAAIGTAPAMTPQQLLQSAAAIRRGQE